MGSVKHLMMEEYENMTSVEQSIADFFIKNEEYMDFSARNISRILYISNATLSRFAKKCGYKGYRELVFDYEKELQEQINEDSISELAKKVKCTYGGLLEEVFQQLDEEKICQAAEMVSSYKRVLVCGLGSSGYAASEMAFRMMRLGLQIQSVTDSQVIQMAAAVADEDCLMIAISLSGNTQTITEAIRIAKSRGAGVVLITANREAEIEFLKMQINPHFLYNCLDTISWLGFSNGNSEITDLAVALGKFLRASIKREDYYTIKQEMEVVDNYLFIQKYRFGDKIEIRHNIPDEVLNFYIPSFIIQPVIENSIVHGLEEQIEKGILWINIQLCDNKYLQFNLTDNGKGMDEEQLKQVIQNYSDKNKKSSIGLSNVYRRLNLLYGEACEFHVTSVAGEGTEVTFRIPVMQVPGNHTLNET